MYDKENRGRNYLPLLSAVQVYQPPSSWFIALTIRVPFGNIFVFSSFRISWTSAIIFSGPKCFAVKRLFLFFGLLSFPMKKLSLQQQHARYVTCLSSLNQVSDFHTWYERYAI
jgi:hypothetical protein